MTGGSFVSPQLRRAVRGIAEPVARGFGRLGLSPNHLTLIGFGISAVAGLAAGVGAWLAAGILVIAGGVFDLFDGALARATGRTSSFGALLDSSFDRWGEGLVYAGIATGMAGAGLAMGTALAGLAGASSFLVSYVRARAEGLGFSPGTGMAAVGFAPREVRLLIVTVGLLAAEPLGGVRLESGGGWSAGALAIGVMLAVLLILTTITAIQRVLFSQRQAARLPAGPGGGPPQP